MPFHFPLEAMLRVRRSMERQQELRLGAANQQVARMRHVVEHLDRQALNMRLRKQRDLGSGMTAAELHFAETCQTMLVKQQIMARRELQRLESLRDQQKVALAQARRERGTFENLRERRRVEYERDQHRREQHYLDELFLLRRTHLRPD